MAARKAVLKTAGQCSELVYETYCIGMGDGTGRMCQLLIEFPLLCQPSQ